MEFTTTTIDAALVLNGFKYVVNRKNASGKIYWRCAVNRQCGTTSNYSHPVLSIKVSLEPPKPPKSYPYVGEMIHICRQNETCRRNESRQTEM